MATVHVDVGTLTNSLELYEHLCFHHVGQHKVLAVPDYRVRQVRNVAAERLTAVESVGQRDGEPVAVVIVGTASLGHVADGQQPVGVEVQLLAFKSLCRHSTGHHQHDRQQTLSPA